LSKASVGVFQARIFRGLLSKAWATTLISSAFQRDLTGNYI